MRGLHNITLPAPRTTWRWYGAHRTRLGMRHLIEVPIEEIDLLSWLGDANMRRRLPYSLRYSNADERRRWAETLMQNHRNLAVPFNVNLNSSERHTVTHHAHRICSDEPEEGVRYYEFQTTDIQSIARPRGYCNACWRRQPEYAQRLTETRWAQPVGYLNHEEEPWRDVARRDFRPR